MEVSGKFNTLVTLPQETTPHPLIRKLCRPQSWYRHLGEQRNLMLLLLLGFKSGLYSL